MFKPTIGRLTLATTAVGAMIGFGCAHQPTSELVEARQAYQEAVNGPAQNKAPARVHDAYTALTKAERVHEDDPGSQDEKDFGRSRNGRGRLQAVEGAQR
jgi:hypothetical protein